MSAGTMSPRLRRTTSPGTSPMTSTSCRCPSRSTRAVRRICEWSASTACSERYSLTKPSTTLMATMRTMMPASVVSPTTAATIAAPTRSTNRKLRNCRPRTLQKLTPWLRRAFGPTAASRRSASAPLRPSGPAASARRTSSAGSDADRARSRDRQSSLLAAVGPPSPAPRGGDADGVLGAFPKGALTAVRCAMLPRCRTPADVQRGA